SSPASHLAFHLDVPHTHHKRAILCVLACPMDWKQLLVSITRSVDQELRLRNEYLASENRILRNQISGRMQLSDSDRRVLAEIGKKLGKKALDEVATVATSDTILAWHRKFIDQKGHSSKPPKLLGRPRMDQEVEDLVVRMAREN